MKKLNSSGIGHHLVVIALVVTAIIGATGYFVWERQKNSDIAAKAAGYTYLNTFPAPGAGGGWVPKVDWYACKRPLPNGSAIVKVIAKSTTKERPTIGVGYGYTEIRSKKMGPRLTAYQFPSLTIPSSQYLTVFNKYGDKGSFFTSYKISWIKATC